MFFRTLRFPLLRMIRSYIGLILLLVVPLCLISVLGMVAGYVPNSEDDITGMAWISVSIVVSFQLFGGAYSMSYMHEDLFTPRKWRMYSLPYKPHVHAGSLLVASTLFSVIQGFVMVLFTQWVYGVNWGNIGLVLLVLLAVSLLSQIVCMILVLAVRNFKMAERLSEVYGIGSMIFAGIMFPLPETAFFNFMSTYGNPVSLGQTAIFSMINGEEMNQVILSVGLLFAVSAVLFVVAALLGRRKLT